MVADRHGTGWRGAYADRKILRGRIAACLRSLLGAMLILVPALLPVATPARAETQGERIALLQAAFLYRFVGFVDWPASTGPDEASFTVGVLGDDPFGTTLDEVFAEPDGNGRSFAVVRASVADSLLHCRMVYVAPTSPESIGPALDILRTRPILIVGYQPEFAQNGGHVNFVVEAERLRFEVNLEAIQDSRLRVSSRLLALARIVEPSGR